MLRCSLRSIEVAGNAYLRHLRTAVAASIRWTGGFSRRVRASRTRRAACRTILRAISRIPPCAVKSDPFKSIGVNYLSPSLSLSLCRESIYKCGSEKETHTYTHDAQLSMSAVEILQRDSRCLIELWIF